MVWCSSHLTPPPPPRQDVSRELRETCATSFSAIVEGVGADACVHYLLRPLLPLLADPTELTQLGAAVCLAAIVQVPLLTPRTAAAIAWVYAGAHPPVVHTLVLVDCYEEVDTLAPTRTWPCCSELASLARRLPRASRRRFSACSLTALSVHTPHSSMLRPSSSHIRHARCGRTRQLWRLLL